MTPKRWCIMVNVPLALVCFTVGTIANWDGKTIRDMDFEMAMREIDGKTNPQVAAEVVRRYATRAVVALRDHGYTNHLLIVDSEIHR